MARAKLISQRQVHAAHAGHQGEDPGRRIVVACVATKAALLCSRRGAITVRAELHKGTPQLWM